MEAMTTRMMRTFRLDHPYLRCITGQTNEPRIPELGVITPMRISAEGCMSSEVFPNKIAVDVMVVKPAETETSISSVDVLKIVPTI
jgi:hypothetical protein